MTEHKKYVLTGGPCTGKTTLLNELSEKGYKTLPEAAREIIEEEQKKTNGVLPWTDFDMFEELNCNRQLQLEYASRSYQSAVFLDRGLPDMIGYYKAGGKKAPDWLESIIKKHKYDAVFVLNPLPAEYFKKDTARKESREEAMHIHNSLISAYRESGYEPIFVPWGVDRTKFVENKISELESKLEQHEHAA